MSLYPGVIDHIPKDRPLRSTVTDNGRFSNIPQVFGITDSAIIGGWALSLSTRKARKMGFYGSVDSYESMFHCLEGLVRLKVSPPLTAKEFVEVV